MHTEVFPFHSKSRQCSPICQPQNYSCLMYPKAAQAALVLSCYVPQLFPYPANTELISNFSKLPSKKHRLIDLGNFVLPIFVFFPHLTLFELVCAALNTVDQQPALAPQNNITQTKETFFSLIQLVVFHFVLFWFFLSSGFLSQ